MFNNVNVIGYGWLMCRNKDGSIAWRRQFQNAPTGVGLDYLAQVGFTGGAQVTPWYIGLIDGAGFSGLAFNDTMAAHAGWRESIIYSGARPTWVNTESGQQVSSNGVFTFTITGTGILHGMFAVSNPTVGGSTGILWATAILPTDASISPGQSVTGNYNIAFTGS